MNRRSIRSVVAGCVLAIAGCTLEPDYQRPQPALAPGWPADPASGASAPASPAGIAVADIGWRDFFTDSRLQRLIEIALEHNPDLRIAALNIAAAQAQYRIQRADLFPSIAAIGLEDVQKNPSGVFSTGASGTGGAGGIGGSGSGPGISRFYEVGLGFTSYEIDLFGRIRSLDHARLEQYLGYVETRRSVQISLLAQIASTYLELLAYREYGEFTQGLIDSQQASYDLVKRSLDGGVATELDLRQAESALDGLRANLIQFNRQAALNQNALVLLIGTPLPDDLLPGASFSQQKLVADLAPGLPSELLTRRPDVLAAEHNLIAANADIGAARAAFFPSITLTGSYGTASSQLSGLFDHGSTAWTFSPQINVPIFAGGANMASLDLEKIEKNVAIARYEQVVQTAFREVADALAERSTLESEIAADQALVNATSESYRLAEMRFRGGVASYLPVLDARRSQTMAVEQLGTAQAAGVLNLVTLYKALGGGWSERTAPQSSSSQPGLHFSGDAASLR